MHKNTKCTLMNQILAAFLSFLMVTAVYAAKPLWTYSAPNPASVTVSDGGTATVSYTVTNYSKRAKTLILQHTQGLSASPCHLAGKGSTCSLSITINGSLIPKQGIHAGPVLCEQGNPNQCYQPSSTNSLNVNRTIVGEVFLNVSPTTLSFAVGDTSTPVTVTNTSSNAAVNNLQVDIPVGSQLTMAGSSACIVGGSIPASGSCTVVFTTAAGVSTEMNTNITIQGDNTNAPTVSVTTTSTTLSVNLPTTIQTLDADGTSVVSIEVENTGAAEANDVQIQLPGSWNGVNILNDNCSNTDIAPSGTCSFDISTATPNIAGEINIQGSNTNIATTPFIAFRIGGGLVFAADGTTAKVITEMDIDAGVVWENCVGLTCTTITGGTDFDNGEQNTQNIVNSIGAGSYAAQVCSDYNVGAFNDWYLPAICEMGDGSPGCGIANIFTNLSAHGFGDFASDDYWSSTDFAPDSAAVQAFDNGSQNTDPKNTVLRVRCVRAFNY